MDKAYRDYLKTKEQYIVPSGFKTELEINPMLFEFQRDIVLWALERGKAAVFADCGLGKGQPIGSKILTPDGWKNIEKLNEGDKVIASNGFSYNVKGVYPKQEQDTWRFHFSDGVSFVVDEDHLHIVRTNNDRQRGKEWRVMSTTDLLECNNLRYGKDDKSRNYDIPVVEPCHFYIENKYTIHPYVLGVLLGDGHLSGNVSISNPDQEIIDKVKMLLPEGVDLNYKDRCEWKIVTGGSGSKRHPFRQELADMGLLDTRANSKFIPQEYLFGSVEDRLELLRGLMDTDGYIKDSSQYYTVSDQLADDVMFLIRSLGGVPTRSIKEDPKYTDTDGNIKSGQDCHIITFSLKTFNPFYLSRKAELWNDNPRDNGRWIDKIEYEGKQKTVCISVDSPDQSYVTENFIVTHNTPMQLEWAKHVHKYTNEDVLIVAPLAVAQQTKREGEKFGVEVNICREQADIQTGINITNYEILHKFDRACFGGIVLDESSILKAYGGKTRKQLQKFANPIPYRLACTATPSPNDLIELVNHAEFLDIMTGKEIVGLFFTQDGNSTQKWRLMGHAQDDFWRWMSEWAVALRKPSDLDYEDNGFILPDLHIEQVTVDSKPMEGYLMPVMAKTLSERREARKSSLKDRVRVCADLVMGTLNED